MSERGELAGRLRERVTILRQAGDRDELGAAIGAWTTIAVRWAAVAADGTGEAVAGEARSAAMRFRVTIRAGMAVRPGDRIGWAGQTFAVRAVIADPAAPDRIGLTMEALR